VSLSTFGSLQISLRGLLAHQRSLDVTGHNVANASTQGYSRQEAVLTASLPQVIPAGARPDGGGAQLGTGVEVAEYRRIRDGFLDLQFRAQASVLGDADARARSLEGVDLALAEPGQNGLAHQLGKFYSAWSAVANDPSSVPARQALVEQAKTVAAAFGELDGQLATIGQQARDELAALVAYDPAAGVYGEVAQIATELAKVGGAIREAYSASQQPNDLLDRRDALLDRLASFGSVTVVDMGGGMTRVLFGNTGTPLVDDTVADNAATPGDERVTWPQPLTSPGGRLGALMELGATPGGTLDSYRSQLASIAQSLATTVNGLHSQGPGGLDFFGFDPALGAAGLSVLRTPADLATNRTGAPGGNDLAREIAALRGGAVDDAYGAFVARVGSEVRQNDRTRANAEVLSRAVEDRRQSVAGVPLDEEMTNLVRFQRGYQASARTMSTLDEVLDVLINRTGRVGL
jgi:flagellar hook-associated protein 1